MNNKCVLAIDYGQKYCGLAYTPNGINVFPVSVVSPESIESEIVQQLESKEIEFFVLGLPLSTNGTENKLCGEVRQFARRLKRQFGLPIKFVDERFSSKSAVTGVPQKRIDDRAAAQILEYYLAAH